MVEPFADRGRDANERALPCETAIAQRGGADAPSYGAGIPLFRREPAEFGRVIAYRATGARGQRSAEPARGAGHHPADLHRTLVGHLEDGRGIAFGVALIGDRYLSCLPARTYIDYGVNDS